MGVDSVDGDGTVDGGGGRLGDDSGTDAIGEQTGTTSDVAELVEWAGP